MLNQKLKVVYSLRMHLEFKRLGFVPLTEMQNPHNTNFTCWVYEATDRFIAEFDRMIEEAKNE